jgi:hypothetical protein
MGLTWREASNDEHGRYILSVGNAHAQSFDCTWWEGHLVSPPTHQLGVARTLPSVHTVIKIQSQFQIKFQIYFEIIINGNFLRLMFVYTTSNVYLTPGFNFEIYISNFRGIVTYLWPKRNNVVDYQ